MQPVKNYNATNSFNVGIAVDLSVNAAIVYNEISFWSQHGKRKDGFIYISYEDMQNRLPFLSKFQLAAAYKLLEDDAWIERKVMKANGAPTIHFRLLRNLTIESKQTELSIESKETELSLTVDKPEDNNSTSAKANEELFYKLVDNLGFNNNRVQYTSGRIKKLNNRLAAFSEDELINASKSLGASPWHMGQNPAHRKYGDIDFLLRNDEMVERWANTPIQGGGSHMGIV